MTLCSGSYLIVLLFSLKTRPAECMTRTQEILLLITIYLYMAVVANIAVEPYEGLYHNLTLTIKKTLHFSASNEVLALYKEHN